MMKINEIEFAANLIKQLHALDRAIANFSDVRDEAGNKSTRLIWRLVAMDAESMRTSQRAVASVMLHGDALELTLKAARQETIDQLQKLGVEV